ncbi:hypothetical protein SBOR_6103 [Sclerotinia borealis F-4128]|uniref:C2H2-type domain-containing protein n=1 Tax=Sclerotinia borealis (strain F-4128) TaxID=1432307 RepID=W9C9T4_SCLBF|nr:hypothetical protein SBOR_6103 [Sclerotinia borealis F-4128]
MGLYVDVDMESQLRVLMPVSVDDRSSGVGDGDGDGYGKETFGVELLTTAESKDENGIEDERRSPNSKAKMGKIRRFKCMVCGQSFGRVEHLTRHERSHTQEGWLKCGIGGDALRRHELVHKKTKRSSLGRGARACSACAMARRKCSGGNPCEGCERRSIECTSFHSNLTTTNIRCRSSNAPSDEMIGAEIYETGERIMSPQSQMSWSKINSPVNPQIDPRTSISHYHPEFGMENLEVTGQQMNIQDLSAGVHQQFSQCTSQNNQMGDVMSEDAHRNSTTSHDHLSTSSSLLPLHSMMDLDGATNSSLMRTGQISNQLHIPDTGLSESLPESAGSWTQYNLSSINWLPYDWVPDYQLEDNDMGLIDAGTDINGFSPAVDTAENPIQRHSIYSTTSAAIFTPSPQTQGHIQLDNSPGPTLSSEGASTSPNSHDTQSTGRYYVDGHGSRLPHVRKTPLEADLSPSISHPTIDDLDGGFAFPATDNSDGYSSDYKQIPHETYHIILDLFEKTCISNSPFFIPFHYTRFPTSHILSRFIAHYIASFHQTLPFIHLPSFDVSTSHWLFLLAMAAIGSHYHRNASYAKPMHEFIRRAIISVGIKGDSSCTKMVMIQVKLLNCVGMMYCGCDELSQVAKSYHGDLIDFCCNEWKASNQISRIETAKSSLNDMDQTKRDWKEWYDAESLLDCMWYFHFQLRPSLSLDDSSVLLPCQEVLWESESAIEWQQLLSCSSSSPTLHNALQRMYTEKRIQSSMGEFSRILLIHGLFRRTWEVENYLKQPLTQWTPTAEKQNLQNATGVGTSPVWLPGIQTYTNWRNSACDCLDILHWHANSVIGAASGMEHPTVLHLHLARVVLLTPFQHISKLAEFLSSNPTPTTKGKGKEKEILETRKYIKRWVTEDQHKARLAIIHAGALFWHVRRFSIDAFYEVEAVYLATLALWAYGLFADCTVISLTSKFSSAHHSSSALRHLREKGHGNRDGNGSGVGGDEGGGRDRDRDGERKRKEEEKDDDGDDDDDEQINECYPSTMQLDRPADDELVQLFVKRGQGMKALIMGVGDLCARNGRGARRVLGEGKKLLAVSGRWGVGRKYEEVLGRLQGEMGRGGGVGL